jgi:hypothetical protein
MTDNEAVSERLPGGRDAGAHLLDGSVRRPVRTWTRSVHHLLKYLEHVGFSGAPKVLGIDEHGREMLSYLPGETVGDSLPWPSWAHSEAALEQIGRWLRMYHDAMTDYQPPRWANWREGGRWQPGLIIGHGDPAPYNAVWNGHLVGLIDWDNAGPVSADNDAAWVAFSWTPLHARSVVTNEGFNDFTQRRRRLTLFLDAYQWQGTVEDAIAIIDARLHQQVAVMRAVAAEGDPAYLAMLERGQDRLLESARKELATL